VFAGPVDCALYTLSLHDALPIFNEDLMLPGNGSEREDTLLHEMAHAADYLLSGHRGHGPSWRSWARHVGCRPTTLYDRPVVRRRRRATPVTRVPPLPPALRRQVA